MGKNGLWSQVEPGLGKLNPKGEINATPSTETYVNAAGETVSANFYTSTNHNIDTNIHKGWRLQFPENWLSVDKSLILNGMLGRFSAINPLDKFGRKELCGIDTGSTYIINVNINTSKIPGP